MSSSNRFPILRLPLLPLEQITKDLTPIDIFFLALCSEKTTETLARLSLTLDALHLTQEVKGAFYIRLSKEEYSYRMKLEATLPFELPGSREMKRPYKISYTYFEGMRHYAGTNVFVVLKEAGYSLSQLLPKVFTAQNVFVTFSDLPKEVALPVISTSFETFRKLRFYHKTHELTSDDLSILLDNCSIDRFILVWSVKEGVKYRKSLRYPEMRIYGAHWLTIECLLNMKCVSLEAHHVLLTIEDVKRFLRKWLEGGFDKLQSVRLTHQFFGFSWHSLLDEFEKTLLNQQDRKAHFKRQLKWNVWEIKRSDGKRAGVCASNGFTFKVL